MFSYVFLVVFPQLRDVSAGNPICSHPWGPEKDVSADSASPKDDTDEVHWWNTSVSLASQLVAMVAVVPLLVAVVLNLSCPSPHGSDILLMTHRSPLRDQVGFEVDPMEHLAQTRGAARAFSSSFKSPMVMSGITSRTHSLPLRNTAVTRIAMASLILSASQAIELRWK